MAADPTPDLATPRPDPSPAYFLDEQAEQLRRSVEQLTREIEEDEAALVRKRELRAKYARIGAEMHVAANVIRASGLRSESRPDGPYIELPNPPRDPAVEGGTE